MNICDTNYEMVILNVSVKECLKFLHRGTELNIHSALHCFTWRPISPTHLYLLHLNANRDKNWEQCSGGNTFRCAVRDN